MAQRIRILIPFSYDENWIGGTYYLLNLITSLNLLPDSEKPIVIIPYNEKLIVEIIKKTKYPYIEFGLAKKNSFFCFTKKLINKAFQILLRYNRIYINPCKRTFDFIFINYYGLNNTVKTGVEINKILCWIPDMQDKTLPQYFTESEIELRDKLYQSVVDKGVKIIFSSNSSKKDFDFFYKKHQNQTFVVPFAVFYSFKNNNNLTINVSQYNLTKDFFIVCNQFWKHKNHTIVIEAAKILREQLTKKNIRIAFTGKENDYRNPDYVTELKKRIQEDELSDIIIFLGFIPRETQLLLLQKSLCVIQPSLFEGWSTVVEDAKAMDKYIILSDIDVHREQITQNCSFFNPYQPEDLVSKMLDVYNREIKPLKIDYYQNQINFAEKFLCVLKNSK